MLSSGKHFFSRRFFLAAVAELLARVWDGTINQDRRHVGIRNSMRDKKHKHVPRARTGHDLYRRALKARERVVRRDD